MLQDRGVVHDPKGDVDVAHHAGSAARTALEHVFGGGELDGGPPSRGQRAQERNRGRGLARSAAGAGDGEEHHEVVSLRSYMRNLLDFAP
jgi:hypothetical protein